MDDQHQSFEQHRQLDDNGAEYWSARSLSKLLDYSEFRHFQAVLARAMDACAGSGYEVDDHFEDSLVLVSIGSGASRKVRETIAELGGTMPEDLPTPAKSIKQIEARKRQKAID